MCLNWCVLEIDNYTKKKQKSCFLLAFFRQIFSFYSLYFCLLNHFSLSLSTALLFLCIFLWFFSCAFWFILLMLEMFEISLLLLFIIVIYDQGKPIRMERKNSGKWFLLNTAVWCLMLQKAPKKKKPQNSFLYFNLCNISI